MSTICRTCLQKSSKTFKTNQTIGDFGGGDVKISIVLRFCMPELYLGLSSNPEICHECKESLKTAYLFKKKCLNTENIIGNFLKNARCTARSVDLHDVLSYFNEQVQLQLELEKAKQKITLNAQDILSEWDEIPDEAVNSEKIIPEVRQAAPNPQISQGNANNMKFCHETGLFFDQEGRFYDCSGYPIDINQIGKNEVNIGRDHVKIGRGEVINRKETSVADVQVTEDHPDFVQNIDSTENFCKIASVFSLSAETTDKDANDNTSNINRVSGTHEVSDTNKVNDISKVNDASNLNEENNTNKGLINIKQEPLEEDMNGENVNFNHCPTDEETLDASETASYEDMQCPSSLQGIIDSLPDINDTNQYVDVPEFVHINNFGLKELEELRRQQQQQNDGTLGDKKIVLNFKNKLPDVPTLAPSDSGEKKTSAEESKEEKQTEAFTKVPLSTLPETLVINGKKMVKCAQGYRLEEDPMSKPIQILSRVKPLLKNKNSAAQADLDSVSGKSVVRRRKRIKIVPVNDKFKLCSQKGAKLDMKISRASTGQRVRLLPATDDRDVVVLFTNYTYEGEYINDHDYLVNPYKRNKVLIEEENQWFCMCYICHTKHHVHHHVTHMLMHGSKCKICQVDLGTPYMLNVHVKSHNKPCRHCTERVPYGQIESHDEEHIKDEIKFENKKRKKVYHSARGRQKKMTLDDTVGAPVKQVPSPIKKPELEPKMEEIKQPEELYVSSIEEEGSVEESSDDEEWRKTGSSSKKPRKRRRRITKHDAESLVVERSSRVLRSNVRKSYSENECEDIFASNLKMMNSSF